MMTGPFVVQKILPSEQTAICQHLQKGTQIKAHFTNLTRYRLDEGHPPTSSSVRERSGLIKKSPLYLRVRARIGPTLPFLSEDEGPTWLKTLPLFVTSSIEYDTFGVCTLLTESYLLGYTRNGKYLIHFLTMDNFNTTVPTCLLHQGHCSWPHPVSLYQRKPNPYQSRHYQILSTI